MSSLSRIVRQPLLHFLVLGGLIFAVYDLITPEVSDDTRGQTAELVITRLQLDRLNAEFEAIWQRPPTSEEQQKLIDSFVREEVLVREALRLGLDRDDTVLRRRLAQKMDYLAASAARAKKPGEEDLAIHYRSNLENYMRPGRLAFEQVFLGEREDEEATQNVLQQLNAGVPFEELGERTLLPPALGMSARAKVDGLFGEGVFKTLLELEGGTWQGPVKSGFGFHFVRIVERQEPEQLSFAEARKDVLEDWSQEQYERAKEEQHQELRSRYRLILPEQGR